MIITQTPFRMSFFGGGTDMESFFRENGGAVLSTTFDKYCYVNRQLLKPLAGTGKMFCYDSPEYVKDMGTPERYYSVCKDCKEGRISAKNLKNKQKAVFLDRDGTINKYAGFLRNIYENISKYNAKVSVCAGATVDFLAGNVNRAPRWMSEHGLEWFYRFLQEPKRMFKRYFVDDVKIIGLIKKYK